MRTLPHLASLLLGFTLAVATPIASAEALPAAPYGMWLADANGRTHMSQVESVPDRVVVLVHGLDDPGWIWDYLIPELLDAGHAVVRFEYDSDPGIAATAAGLGASLEDLHRRGAHRVDLVAHSMGGLVSRDVLTRSDWYDGDGHGSVVLPAVDRLILVGTPNHGSKFAKLRPIAELRGQIVRGLRDGEWRAGSGDTGNGRAATDLLPDSTFLATLNTRPLPTHTTISIIAARIIAPDSTCLDNAMVRLASSVRRMKLDDEADQLHDQLKTSLAGMADGLGDGVVTVRSAKLDGVEDFVLVDANHQSMLYNFVKSDRVPPAVPIVLERLEPAECRSAAAGTD